MFKAIEQKRTTHLNHLLDTIPETKSTATQIVEDLMDLMQQANFDLVLSEYKGVIFERALAWQSFLSKLNKSYRISIQVSLA